MKPLLFKFAVLFLIINFNCFGVLSIGQTIAYLNDVETSSKNNFSAGALDFYLTSPADFSPEVMPTQNSVRNISVINDGILGFEYNLQTEDETGDLCNNLNLTVTRNGVDIDYTGTLKDFTYDAGQFVEPDNWQFTTSLTSNDPSLENKTCDFDFVFDGEQLEGAGFSDQEIISNTVTSGTWTTPQPPTTSGYSPIADSYVSEKSPNSNYGSDQELEIRSKNCPNPLENKRTFIKFDFHFPIGTIIHSAFLKLYMKDAPSGDRTYEARRILGDWKERDPGPGDGIDWNNQPGVDVITNSVSTGDSNPKWLSWNVADDIMGFVENLYSNYGWRLSDSIEGEHTSFEAKFHSRESNDADKRPVLEMTLTPPEITTNHLVVNEVYYDVGSGEGNDPNNEWVEIYNPTNLEVDITGWEICEASGCDIIPSTSPIPAHGFAVASGKTSTWEDYWIFPVGTITINLPGDRIGSNGLGDDGDRVILKNASDVAIDSVSYGDDTTYFELPLSGKGKSLARIIKGYDNDSAFDWIINATPNPGTNPSVDGIETIIFTYQGIEFLESGPVSDEEGESNDSPEDIMDAEEPIIEEPTPGVGEGEEITEEEPAVIEQAPVPEEPTPPPPPDPEPEQELEPNI